ncbi:MAG: hypothetical protein LIP02_08055 [Bacteroidales bacterium]|nr:hypothetical protein [Bacteroidales bacterium]
MVEEERAIERVFYPNPREGLFFDMTAVNHPSMLAFNRLGYYDHARHLEGWNRLTTWDTYGHDYRGMPLPVPKALQDITISKATKIDGDNPFYSYKGWVAMPGRWNTDLEQGLVKYKWGRTSYRHIYSTPFISEEGTEWTFIEIDGMDLYNRWSPITWISVEYGESS